MNALAAIETVRKNRDTAAPELLAWPLIRTLVAFDTTSRDSNLALIDWVREYLGFELRCLPFDDPDEFFAEVNDYAQRFVPEMHRVSPDAHIDFDALSATPGFETGGASDIAALGRYRTGEDRHGKVSFGTEAALFDGAAIPSIVCGPGHIAQAHQPNEWVTIEQLARCEAFMRRPAERICVA